VTGPAPWLEIDQIIGRLRHAVDQVMADGGLYDERTAARAFRQAEGDPVAAANLVQALRAALPRFGAALPVEGRRSSPLPVVVAHPGTGEAVTIGHVRATEARLDAAVRRYAPQSPDGRQAAEPSGGLSGEALLEQLRQAGGCGVGSDHAPGC